ncbi:hypothetical protein OAY27_02835 [Candidatus Pelagibacter sp.]|nr:hypothetical protein [Candidatus Pelagibacter sp.]|tara:strand:- start:68 stop:316 length:249 start_codon:yes stop_codon:yes gene_type:complete
MNLEPIKKLISNFLNAEKTKNQKIYYTLSLGWIIFIGYLTWWNGLRNPSLDKSFRWDEWIWFGLVPALSPYLFYYIWKKKEY